MDKSNIAYVIAYIFTILSLNMHINCIYIISVYSKVMEVLKMYELFGKNKCNEVEYLGQFHTEQATLDAYDYYWGMGYKHIRYCQNITR